MFLCEFSAIWRSCSSVNFLPPPGVQFVPSERRIVPGANLSLFVWPLAVPFAQIVEVMPLILGLAFKFRFKISGSKVWSDTLPAFNQRRSNVASRLSGQPTRQDLAIQDQSHR